MSLGTSLDRPQFSPLQNKRAQSDVSSSSSFKTMNVLL